MPWTHPLRSRPSTPTRPALRQAALRQAAVSAAVTAALLSAATAADADTALAPVAGATLGAVAVALGALAAVLAYRLGRQARDPRETEVPGKALPMHVPVNPACLAQAEALTDALPAPAVLLVSNGAEWQCRHANAAARRTWPQADGDNWPGGLRERLAGPTAAAADDAWQLLAGPSWLLAWHAAAVLSVASADSKRRSESESFGFTLSHDLRAPLRVVEGFARIVKEDYGTQLDRVGNDHLDRVIGAAARMNLMIDAMLSLARLSQQPLTRQRVNLSQLAGLVVEELRRSAPGRVVEVDIEPALQADGDPTLLRLVLDNLLGNAWKYTAKATHPLIEVRSEPPSGKGGMGFVVRDNGAGFDMRSADRLFGLFQRLHSASDFPGHGVGLASVRRIVERHGGRVWADSVPGRGASFHVVLGAG
jgi:signal transduction histidine kinase